MGVVWKKFIFILNIQYNNEIMFKKMRSRSKDFDIIYTFGFNLPLNESLNSHYA